MAELEGERKKAMEERDQARRDDATLAGDQIEELNSLADLLAADNSADMRTRVRAALRAVVDHVALLVLADGNSKVRRAAVRIQFRRGAARHDVIIARTKHLELGARYDALSFASAGLTGEIDIRTPADAAKAQRFLASL